MPDVAAQWIEEDPDQRVFDLLLLRGYASAKAQYDQVGGDVTKLEKSRLMDQVIRNDFLLGRFD